MVYYHKLGWWIMTKFAVFFAAFSAHARCTRASPPFLQWRESSDENRSVPVPVCQFSIRGLNVAASRVFRSRDILRPPVAMSGLYHPTDYVVEKSHITTLDKYKELHRKSLEDPESFWSEIANEFHWQTPYQPGNFVSYNIDITKGKIFVKWLEGAVTNVCFNALDRNVRNGHGDKIAYYW